MSETTLYRKVHELKTWPVFYEKIIDGSKPFEVRNNDRNFKVGDVLFLREYDPDAEAYTGRSCQKEVTYILGDNPFFQMNNTVIMGIGTLEQPETEQPVSPTVTKEKIIDRLEQLIDTAINGQGDVSYDRDVLDSIYNLFSAQLSPNSNEDVDMQRHLCASCIHEVPTCNGNPEFGSNIGHDNVIRCAEYVDVQSTNSNEGEGKLRNELIKYDTWLYSKGKESDAFTSDELVDLYLKISEPKPIKE